MKHWKLLYSGTAWDLCNPPREVHPLDIAIPLSRIPRWGGHTIRTITVAEHSIHVSRWVMEMTDGDRTAAAQGLLHDAAEALLSFDAPTPVKDLIPAIRELEAIHLETVLRAFDLPTEMHPAVREADRVMFANEAARNMPDTPYEIYDPADVEAFVRFQYWTEDESRNEFLKEGQTLGLW